MADEVIDEFEDPGTAVKVEWENLKGRLLLVYPREKIIQPTTDYGDKDAIRADMVVLDGEGSPKEMPDILVFPMRLLGQLRSATGTGKPVLGRLEQGPERIKGNYPWQLAKGSDAEKQIARDYVRNRPVVSDPGSGDAPF